MTTTMLPPTSTPAGAPASCCAEYAGLSRRSLLGRSVGGALALAGASTVIGSGVLTTAPAQAASADSVLVVLSMRGAHDGMSLLVPYGDPVYYQARPRIAIPADRLLAKDGFLGLHPNLAPLLPLWNAGQMTAVHAAGLPVANRSHFSAMEVLEDADPGSTVRLGWLNRLVGQIAGTSPLQGFYVGGGVIPTALYGPEPVMAAGDVDGVTIPGNGQSGNPDGRTRSLHTMWDDQPSALASAMRSTLAAVDQFAPVRAAADDAASYPASDLGRGLAEAARIIRGDAGVAALTLDQGSWDMHAGLGTLSWGQMLTMATDFAGAIAAFFDDLGTQRSKVTLLAFSEFGRRVAENANYGLDHGYGNVMWAFGAGVRGGRYWGTFPSLTNTLDADLTVTTDYRDVLADVLEARFPAASVATVFPGLSRHRVGMMTGI